MADLFDNAPCGYVVLAPDGSIRRLNATLRGWLGLAGGETAPGRFHDLLTTPGRIIFETNLAPLLRLQGGVEEVVLDLRTAQGQVMPVQINALSLRGADGALAEIRIAVFRTGERRRYERDLREREASAARRLADARSASELREQFIAVLGHDLRNPLASMMGAARLLRREVQSDKAVTVLSMMETSAERMAGLIDDVLDFARGRLGGGIILHRAPVDLAPVLRHLADELEASQPGRTIQCELNLAAPVNVDQGRIAQLVSNLLGNALTHGDPRAPVSLRAFQDGGRLEISVTNAGAPIPAEAMARLFQPFFRGEARPSQLGLGLGLHIASEIAKAHGGTLDVSSDAVETRFTLSVPLT